MKKSIAMLFTLCACVTHACWVGAQGILYNPHEYYIAGINNYIVHYDEQVPGVYSNCVDAAMPITVFIKTAPTTTTDSPDYSAMGTITRALLQYKILPDGSWITVQDINNPAWLIYFNKPTTLFGKNTIDLPDVPDGTELLIRLYLSDGILETGELDSSISDWVIRSTESDGTLQLSSFRWGPPFMMHIRKIGRRPYQ